MVAAVVGRETNDNGNLQSVTTYAGGPAALSSLPAFTTTFGYDGVNRLSTANDTGGWSRTYGYDPYGNMWVTGYSGVTPPGNMPTSNVYGNNRINGASYDSTGNQTVVSGDTLTYDAENRLVSAYDPVTHGTETYVYDGDGRRVEKSGPGGTTTYVYDAFGNLAAEYGAMQGNPPCTTCYLSYDWLGSVRMVTDASGTVKARHYFLPFGQEIPANTAGRNGQWGSTSDVEQKFTGKVRDQETGLDYFGARYYGSALGRFTSPDSGPFIWSDPQTLNRYVYTRDNPLKLIDPTGKYFVVAAQDTEFFQKALSDIYRRPGGRELVNALANSDRPVLVDRGELNTAVTGIAGVSEALTVSGTAGVSGVHTTLGTDADLFAGAQMAPGKVGPGVTTVHELEHDEQGLNKGQTSLAAGAAAMAAGDAPDSPGKSNTLGGTAQKSAEEIMGEKPDMNSKDANTAVHTILQSRQQQWQKSPTRAKICSQNKDVCH